MEFSTRKKNKIPQSFSQRNKNLSTIRWMSITSIILTFCIIGFTIWFVYTNIYQTIGKVQVLLLTDTDLHFEPIDFKLYESTQSYWESHQNLAKLTITRDPFKAMTTSSPSNSEIIPTQNITQDQL